MKTFSVWHAKTIVNDKGNVTGVKGGFGFEPTVFPDDYEHVADVDAPSLTHVFPLTQNQLAPWVTLDGIRPQPNVDQAHVRSTSVQDVVEFMGQLFVVNMIGYHMVSIEGEHTRIPPQMGPIE